jgi:hypothetical protein
MAAGRPIYIDSVFVPDRGFFLFFYAVALKNVLISKIRLLPNYSALFPIPEDDI